jgi:multiple sugar transport system ATP-binding protein
MADIHIDSIQKRFGAATALERVDLRIQHGEFLALLGPSGCGKTTLLRIIAGLETQSSGRIFIGGRDISRLPPRHRGLAMVFQNYAVFPHLSVRENIGFGLRMTGAPEARIRRQVDRMAELLQIGATLDRHPAQLSGGQRQRVAVARALATEPAVLLMDEPLSNLDALLRLEMRAELKSVLRNAGTTTIYVTHDQTEAMGLADRIAVLHQGRIEQLATPAEIYANPATRFVGGFVGSPPMNFLTLEARHGRVCLGTITLTVPPSRAPNTGAQNGPILLGLRGEDVEEGEGFPLSVDVCEPMGSHSLITGRTEGQRLRVVLPAARLPKPGDILSLRPLPGRLRWMNHATGHAIGDSQ